MALIATKAADKRRPPFLPDEIFEKLKCYDCNGYLSDPPILKHPELGSICGNCSEFNNTQNFIRNTEYEVLASFMEFPCRNQGCRKRILFGKTTEHDFTCKFKMYDCPLNCQWAGFYQKIGTHFEEKHKHNLVKHECFSPTLTKNCEEMLLDQRDNNLFLVQTKCVVAEYRFWCLIRHFGSANVKNTTLFKYKLEFRGNKNIKSFFSKEKSVLSDFCFIMDKVSALEINIIELLKYLNCPTSINCKIHIIPI